MTLFWAVIIIGQSHNPGADTGRAEVAMPPNLVSETLRRGLYTSVVGRRLLFFQQLGSTMDRAAAEAEADAEEGTVVVAETQTASRGRLGRTWLSKPGNLYCSIVFYPSQDELPFVSPLAGVALVRAIRRTCRLDPALKWPNDVMVDGKKVAGILVESAVSGDQVKHAVLGIGVNVGLTPEELEELPVAATSLNAETGRETPRDELLARLLHEVDGLYLQLKRGVSPLAEWRGMLETLGQQVEIAGPDGPLSGLAEKVDEQGNLVLRLDDGRRVLLTSGDVTLRQAGTAAIS